MQKVSKQSLAMIALSILLAISIALTFTFAVAQDTKTATGNITFSGTAALFLDGFADTAGERTFTVTVGSDNTLTYLGAETKTTLSDFKFGLATTSAPAYVNVQIEASGANIGSEGQKKCVTYALKKNITGLGNATAQSYASETKLAAGTSWTIDDLLSFTAANTAYDATDTGSKITIRISAGMDKMANDGSDR